MKRTWHFGTTFLRSSGELSESEQQAHLCTDLERSSQVGGAGQDHSPGIWPGHNKNSSRLLLIALRSPLLAYSETSLHENWSVEWKGLTFVSRYEGDMTGAVELLLFLRSGLINWGSTCDWELWAFLMVWPPRASEWVILTASHIPRICKSWRTTFTSFTFISQT